MKPRTALTGLLAIAALAATVSCGGGDYGADATYTVGGTLAGSAGAVVLQLNGAGNISASAPGPFTFAGGLASGAAYDVTASGAQNCNVANGKGTIGSTNVTNVAITCTTVVRSASLSGAQQNPAVTTAAVGRGALVVDPATKAVTGGMTFSGLTPTTGGHHIHQAPAGDPAGNGPVIIGLSLAPGGGVATVPAGTILTDAQYAALLAGELYFNIHTAANPGGEIRGQINVRGGVTAGLATLNGASEVPANASTATGRGTIVFDSTSREVVVAYVTHNVAGATVAHIHTGAPGVAGPPDVATLVQGTNVYSAPHPSTLTSQAATDLKAGNTYFNVHSGAVPGGEIRGQIAVQ